MIRYASAASFIGLFDYLKAIGIRPEEVAEPGVVALIQRSGSARIPAWLMVDILERSAKQLDDPLFGLRYGQHIDPKTYGPISLLWRYAPNVRYSNRVTTRILHHYNEGVALTARTDDEDMSTLIYRVDTDLAGEMRHFLESGVSFMLRVCRLIMGASWVPQRVTFMHDPVCDAARYSEIMNAPVKFGALENSVVMTTADFDRRSPEYDAEILAFVEQSLLRLAEQDPLPFQERLNQVVDDLLAIHKPLLAKAAAAMAMSNRTLQRHLAAEGTSFREVVSARRQHIVRTWRQRSSKPSLSLLAERTAFSEASALSRFLRKHPAGPRGTADGDEEA